MEAMVEEKAYLLRNNDRCDRCSSQAFVWVNGVSGDLLFCRHHFLKSEDSIRAYAFEIVDETEKINNNPSPASQESL